MRYLVEFAAGVALDIEEITAYIAEFDSKAKALHVHDRLNNVIGSLATFPERGSRPRELIELGIREYRQVFFKPYRVIYTVEEKRVLVHMVVDGRRDMQTLLARELLGR